MEGQHQKWVNLSYLALAAVVAYVVFAVSVQLVGAYDLEARVKSIEWIIRGLSLVAAAAVFFGLSRHQQANQFMNEVVVELSRVTWPTQKETASATMIVIIMVVVSGMVLGLLDYLWTTLLKWVL